MKRFSFNRLLQPDSNETKFYYGKPCSTINFFRWPRLSPNASSIFRHFFLRKDIIRQREPKVIEPKATTKHFFLWLKIFCVMEKYCANGRESFRKGYQEGLGRIKIRLHPAKRILRIITSTEQRKNSCSCYRCKYRTVSEFCNIRKKSRQREEWKIDFGPSMIF